MDIIVNAQTTATTASRCYIAIYQARCAHRMRRPLILGNVPSKCKILKVRTHKVRKDTLI
jgi:hypothetical protein